MSGKESTDCTPIWRWYLEDKTERNEKWFTIFWTGEAEGRIFPVKNDPIRAAEFQMDVQVYFFLGAALFDHDVVQYGGDQG